MSQEDTPEYPNTLVSGTLSRPWRSDEVWRELWRTQYNSPIWEHAKGIIVNNRGLRIEILIEDNEAKSHLLSNGLALGTETVMFKPYRGVFAILRNVPLEATRADVLDTIQHMGWTVSGVLPHTRVSQQLEFRPGDNREMLTGRWVCMLDQSPPLSRDTSGRKIYRARAFGGRWISFAIAHHRPPSTVRPQADNSPEQPPQNGILCRQVPDNERLPHEERLRPPPPPDHPIGPVEPSTYASVVEGPVETHPTEAGDEQATQPPPTVHRPPPTQGEGENTSANDTTNQVAGSHAAQTAREVSPAGEQNTTDVTTRATPPPAPLTPVTTHNRYHVRLRVGNLESGHSVESILKLFNLSSAEGHTATLHSNQRWQGGNHTVEDHAVVSVPTDRAPDVLKLSGTEVRGRRITVTYAAAGTTTATAAITAADAAANPTEPPSSPPASASPKGSKKSKKKKGKAKANGVFATAPPPASPKPPGANGELEPADTVELFISDTKLRCPFQFRKRIHDSLEHDYCFPAVNYPVPQMESVRDKAGNRRGRYTVRMWLPRPVAEHLARSRLSFGGEKYRMNIVTRRAEREYGLIIPSLPGEVTQYDIESVLQEQFGSEHLLGRCDLNLRTSGVTKTFSFHVNGSAVDTFLHHHVILDGKRYQIEPAFPIPASKSNRSRRKKGSRAAKDRAKADTKRPTLVSSTTSDDPADGSMSRAFIHSAEDEQDYRESPKPMEVEHQDTPTDGPTEDERRQHPSRDEHPGTPQMINVSNHTTLTQVSQVTQVSQTIVVLESPGRDNHVVEEVADDNDQYPNRDWMDTPPDDRLGLCAPQPTSNFALARLTTGSTGVTCTEGLPRSEPDPDLEHELTEDAAEATATDTDGHSAPEGDVEMPEATPDDHPETSGIHPPAGTEPAGDVDNLPEDERADAYAPSTTPFPQSPTSEQENMDFGAGNIGNSDTEQPNTTSLPLTGVDTAYPESSTATDVANALQMVLYDPSVAASHDGHMSPLNRLVAYDDTQDDIPQDLTVTLGATPTEEADTRASPSVPYNITQGNAQLDEISVTGGAEESMLQLVPYEPTQDSISPPAVETPVTTDPTVEPALLQAAEEPAPETTTEPQAAHQVGARALTVTAETPASHQIPATVSGGAGSTSEQEARPTTQQDVESAAEPTAEAMVESHTDHQIPTTASGMTGSTPEQEARPTTQQSVESAAEPTAEAVVEHHTDHQIPATVSGEAGPTSEQETGPTAQLDVEPAAESTAETTVESHADRQTQAEPSGPRLNEPSNNDILDGTPLSLCASNTILALEDGEILSYEDMETERSTPQLSPVPRSKSVTKRSRIRVGTSDDEPKQTRPPKQRAKKFHNPQMTTGKGRAQRLTRSANERKKPPCTPSHTLSKSAVAAQTAASQVLAATRQAAAANNQRSQANSQENLQCSADVVEMLKKDKVDGLSHRSAIFMAQFGLETNEQDIREKWRTCDGPIRPKLLLMMLALNKFSFTPLSQNPELPTTVSMQDRNQVAAHLLYSIVGVTESRVELWKESQPLPAAIGTLWRKLCRTRDAHNFPPDKLAQTVRNLTGRQLNMKVYKALAEAAAIERIRIREAQRAPRSTMMYSQSPKPGKATSSRHK